MLAAWGALRAPGHLAGLVALLVLVVVVPALAHVAVPRRWRASWRHAHGREGARSAYITNRQRRAVLFADRHRCAYCHSLLQPQIDHVIPWSHGGRTWLPNLVTLCAVHNRIKSDYEPGRGYRPFEGADNIRLAHEILLAERRHRRNPARLARAFLGLAA